MKGAKGKGSVQGLSSRWCDAGGVDVIFVQIHF